MEVCPLNVTGSPRSGRLPTGKPIAPGSPLFRSANAAENATFPAVR